MKKSGTFMVAAAVVIVLLWFPLLSSRASIQPPQIASGALAEQRYANIQMFEGVPASEIPSAMTFMAASLGVSCNFCHVSGRFDSDDKQTKRTARLMISMVRALNANQFGARQIVTCYTCHRGSPRPQSSPTLAWAGEPAAVPAAGAVALPSARQVIDHYVTALGGRAVLRRLRTRRVTGSRVNADGSVIPAEVYQSSAGKVASLATYPNITFFAGYNGRQAWARDSHGGSDLSRELRMVVERDAEFFPALATLERGRDIRVTGRETIGSQTFYVLVAGAPDGATETFWFDAETGLLAHRRYDVRTLLGSFPMQIDYGDYRSVDGARLPFLLRWSRPGLEWSRRVAEARHNVPIPDVRFESASAVR